jgi:hypothetical protein
MAEKQYSANNQSGPETPLYSCLFPVQPCNFLHHKLQSHNNGKHNLSNFFKKQSLKMLAGEELQPTQKFQPGDENLEGNQLYHGCATLKWYIFWTSIGSTHQTITNHRVQIKAISEQILTNHHKLTISHAYAHPSPAAAKRQPVCSQSNKTTLSNHLFTSTEKCSILTI